jgi:hypothetical protein
VPLHQEDLEDEVLLLDTFVELRVVTIDGGLEELRRGFEVDSEGRED